MISGQIKEIIKGYVNNAKLSDLVLGVVTGTTPLKIKIENGLEIPEKFLIIPERLSKGIYKTEVLGEEKAVTFKDITLDLGHKVAMIKATGGQKYYVLDRVIE